MNSLACLLCLCWELRTHSLNCFLSPLPGFLLFLPIPIQRRGPIPAAALQPYYRPGASIWTGSYMWYGHKKQEGAWEYPGPLRGWEPVGTLIQINMGSIIEQLEFKSCHLHILAIWLEQVTYILWSCVLNCKWKWIIVLTLQESIYGVQIRLGI